MWFDFCYQCKWCPEKVMAWKSSSLKWPIMCQTKHKTLFTHSLWVVWPVRNGSEALWLIRLVIHANKQPVWLMSVCYMLARMRVRRQSSSSIEIWCEGVWTPYLVWNMILSYVYRVAQKQKAVYYCNQLATFIIFVWHIISIGSSQSECNKKWNLMCGWLYTP